MSELEGVIKYQLNHQYKTLSSTISITELNAWRTVILKMGFIGQDATRYAGYGFGNISQRLTETNPEFLISGTQTGHISSLNTSDTAQILKAEPNKNSIQSIGETKPSSESLTHASVYQTNQKIQAVVHGHIPIIWENTHALHLAHTPKNIPYGTPAMATAVNQLLININNPTQGIFSLLGHEDGIICFSDTMENAVLLLIKTYTQALILK